MALTREQDRDRKRRDRAVMTDEQREEERRKARERMERGRRASGIRPRKPAQPKLPKAVRSKRKQPARVVEVKSDVPSEVRAAYSRAHPNSVIKRKYPTWQALRKDWGHG